MGSLGTTVRNDMLNLTSNKRLEHLTVQATLPRFKRHVAVNSKDVVFVSMLPAFRATGGLATGDEVGAKLERLQHDGMSKLARSVAAGELICFDWHNSIWLPMFQFDPQTLEMTAVVHQIFCELSGSMDGWEVTQWFARPHAALGNAMPIERLDISLEALLNAARLDRFIARG